MNFIRREQKMKYFNYAILMTAALFFGAFNVAAQETEAVVVDEVVAQVNDGVITLSRVKREMQAAIDSLRQEGKSAEEAKNLVESRKGELIANLIQEELLVQKAKEMGADSEVEARVNQTLAQRMKELNIKTLDELYKQMEAAGVSPEEVRANLRNQIMREMVFEREVDARIYWGIPVKDIKAYYEQNKAKFTKPETVTISEIFLSFAGRDEKAVREKAKQIVAQLRSGADFEKLALENSDRPNVAVDKGKAGTFPVSELDPKFANPLKSVKVGGYTDPIDVEDVGLEIIRLDERTGASSEAFFDENVVRRVIAYEKIPDERKKFMTTLRQDAYIKINDTYRPMVSPILFADDRKTEKASK
jgi:peptidyl-prolyl cis-trans isomerase SurA